MKRVRVISTKHRPVHPPAKRKAGWGVPGGLTWFVMRRLSRVVALASLKVILSFSGYGHRGALTSPARNGPLQHRLALPGKCCTDQAWLDVRTLPCRLTFADHS